MANPDGKVVNLEAVGQLPGRGNWEVASYKGLLIFVCPNYAPRVLDPETGELKRLDPLPLNSLSL